MPSNEIRGVPLRVLAEDIARQHQTVQEYKRALKDEQHKLDTLKASLVEYVNDGDYIDTSEGFTVAATVPLPGPQQADQVYLKQVGPILEDMGLAERKETYVGLNKQAVFDLAPELVAVGVNPNDLYPGYQVPDVDIRVVKTPKRR